MFKFNFSADDSDHQPSDKETLSEKIPTNACEVAREILIDDVKKLQNFIEKCFSNYVTSYFRNIMNINHVSADVIVQMIKNSESANSSLLVANGIHSDLIPAVYEGGLKIWECTVDLIDYIAHSDLQLEGKKVLDLGCGAGLVGILALKKGSFVHFQDYNEEVIKYVTIPNVLLNTNNEEQDRCKFYYGDWEAFTDLLENKFEDDTNKYDYIFTSETIYNPDNYSKLIDVFENALKPDGTVYLAAKSHYFGIGGGLWHFEQDLEREGLYEYQVCWDRSEGVKRAILEIRFK